ncbi:MAG: hypothetical protein KAQ98_01200 [Bacteriovoracaceae bacterium]|nr:hypothetical protein [Bacteriovoracaceae bacterium]
MEVIKKTDKYMIVKKRSGRYGVRSMSRSWINGPEKERILLEAGLANSKPKKTKKTSKENEEEKSEEPGTARA